MITHAASRKHYYTVLLDRTLSQAFLLYLLFNGAKNIFRRRRQWVLFFPRICDILLKASKKQGVGMLFARSSAAGAHADKIN